MAWRIKFFKGAEATIPQLEPGQPGFCTDAGTELLYVGDAAGTSNVLIGAYDMLRMTVGGTVSGNITMSGADLVLDHDPIADMEAATKQYVDTTSGAIELTWDGDLKAMLTVK